MNLGATPTVEDFNGAAQLAVGASVEIFVKVFVPANAPVGMTEIMTVTVDGALPTTTDSAVDATTVIDGNLQLTKTAAPASVLPTLPTATVLADFHPISYTVNYQNLGAAGITDVVVIDAIPANTRLVVVTDGADDVDAPTPLVGLEYSTNGGLAWIAWNAGVAPAPAADHTNGGVTHIRWNIGALAGGASGSVSFQVLVD